MKLQDDEKQVLRLIAGELKSTKGISENRVVTIIRKFRSHGYVAENSITKRGLHVAAKLSQAEAKNGTVHRQEESGLESRSGSGDSGRDQAGSRNRIDQSCERSIAETSERSIDSLLSDSGDLSGADGGEKPDSGAVPEADSDASGFDSDWD